MTTMSAPKKVFIKTFGCQMNVYDSQRMLDALGAAGYRLTAEATQAELIILNTCHIREKAAEKVYSELGRLRQVRTMRQAEGKATKIAVAGCVAQAEGEEILARAPGVDFVIGPQSYHRLPELIGRNAATGAAIVETEFPAAEKFERLQKTAPRAVPSAFLTVQEGCDKFCTFCVVPYTRGAEYSRPPEQILEEARRLAERGTVELTLLGQNVNAYRARGADGKVWGLADLLFTLSEIGSIKRLRFTTSHPNDMTDELIATHRDLPKLMPYLHLPFQSGSDKILRAMNRKHTAAQYFDIVHKLKAARSDLALSTDIIVGFPGETEADFAQTLAIVDKVRFAQSYTFKYSARPGTPAAEKPEQVPEAVKAERLWRLQDLLKQHQLAFNEATVGRELEVLWETVGKRQNQIVGRSPYLQAVHTEGSPQLLGRITSTKIVAAGPNSLQGVIQKVNECAI